MKPMRTARQPFDLPAFLALWVLLLLSTPGRALDAVPLYEHLPLGSMLMERFPGTGISSAVALNENGDAVGYALINSRFEAFIYTQEAGVQLLPELSSAWPHHVAVDITERTDGQVLIAGNALPDSSTDQLRDPGNPLIWVFDTATARVTETVEVGVLPGDEVGRIHAINDKGVAVGYSRLPGEPTQPVVYDFQSRTLSPSTLSFIPVDINNANRVAGNLPGSDGGGMRALIEPDGTVLFEEGLGHPAEARIFQVTAINSGVTLGATFLFPYTDGSGRLIKGAGQGDSFGNWLTHWNSSSLDWAYDINGPGDVVGDIGTRNAIRGGLYIKSLDQVYLLQDLTDPPGAAIDSGRAINDAGWVAGGSGAATLLKRTGDMPVPPSPESLTALPHEPTWQQPWNAITLTWSDDSTLTQSYTLERRVSGTQSWNVILTDWINLSYWDRNVALGETYDYRVKARGIAGFSDYSNLATATAPSEPVDNEDPLVAFVEPTDGQSVSSNVSLVAEASDNVGVTFMEILYSSASVTTTHLCSGQDVTRLECSWNTRKLDPGTYQLTARASDAMNNGSSVRIQVELTSTDGGGKGGGKGGGGGGSGNDGERSGSEKGAKKCADGRDNDGDGLIDAQDPDCR